MGEKITPPNFSIILVAVMPSPKDLEIARLLGWYRIPFRFAPKVIRVDFLAFYQPSSFGKNKGSRIEVYSEVRGVELTTRRILFSKEPNHPRADEEYYKIQLGELQKLDTPILAGKWKRITFLYTTGKKLLGAGKIDDLVIRNGERKILWHSLRERAHESKQYSKGEYAEIDFNPALVSFLEEYKDFLDHEEW